MYFNSNTTLFAVMIILFLQKMDLENSQSNGVRSQKTNSTGPTTHRAVGHCPSWGGDFLALPLLCYPRVLLHIELQPLSNLAIM